MKKKEILAVIPARSGSRGVPGKNVRTICGKPLISWAIENARNSQYINRIIFSSDSEEYCRIAREYGAETPFLRPVELANDKACDLDVITHAVLWLAENEGYRPDFIVRLQPTNPTFITDLIDKGIKLLIDDEQADSLRPIIESPKHPYKMWRIRENNITIEPFLNREITGFMEPFNMGRQQLPSAYVQVGAMEILRYSTLMDKKSMAGERILYLLVKDPLMTVNIDTEFDFFIAEAALNLLIKKQIIR